MNPLQRLPAVGFPVPVEARRTTADVTDAYLDGGNWLDLLKEVAAPQDGQAVEALEGLLDLARSSAWADLQLAAEDLLGQFRGTSSGWVAARLVLSPTTDDILYAFDMDRSGAGDAKPGWERAIDRWAAQGGREAFDRLTAILGSPRPRLSAVVRSALIKMQDRADASMHADINGVLGTAVPHRRAGRRTEADGDCLIHALLGASSQNVYRCEAGTVREVRRLLGTSLASHDPGALPEPIAQVVRRFYEELLEVCLCVEGSDQPNRPALERVVLQLGLRARDPVPFDQLAVDARRAVLKACADFLAEPGHYLPCSLVPLLAQVSGQAVSLYVDGRGWLHFGRDGRPCAPTQEAVAIRFHAHRQHYERVEGPLNDAVPGEPPACRVPRFPVERRPRSVEMPTSSFSTRTGSTSSLSELGAKAVVSAPSRPRQDGLVARFFSWVGGLFR